jgi:hypothetical protein
MDLDPYDNNFQSQYLNFDGITDQTVIDKLYSNMVEIDIDSYIKNTPVVSNGFYMPITNIYKQCPQCDGSFYSECIGGDTITISVLDSSHIIGHIYNKHECRLCGKQWHVIRLPKNQLPVVSEEYQYLLKNPTQHMSEWDDVIVHDGVVPHETECITSPRKRRSYCVIC